MLPQPAASQHQGDGLKPSLEIAPPGATPIHSGCPLGEKPYGSEYARKGVPPQALSSSERIALASSKQATLDGKASRLGIQDALWRHNATRVFARSPTGRLSLSLTATGSSNPVVRLEDLRAQTFYVTLPPRISPSPLNAKTRKNKVSAARHRIAGATSAHPAGVFLC